MSLQIRHATMQDVTDLARLMSQLTRRVITADIMADRLRFVEQSPIDWLFVCCDDAGEVVGALGFRLRESLDDAVRYGEISVIVVDERCRRQGVGRFLIDFAERLAVEHGCHGTWLVSGFSRKDEAHKFYQALGYETTGYRFVKHFHA